MGGCEGVDRRDRGQAESRHRQRFNGSWFCSTGAAEDGRAPTEELACLWVWCF